MYLETERSTYFRQIEEDAEKYAAVILELKDAIGSFQSKDMSELVRFRQHVERQLVCLTDETQVSFIWTSSAISRAPAKPKPLWSTRRRTACCTAGVSQVRGLPFQEAGGVEDGGRALLQAGRHRLEAPVLEAHRRPRIGAARQIGELLQQGPFTSCTGRMHAPCARHTPTAHAVRCAGAGGTDEDTAHGFDDVDVAACRSKTRWTW